MGIHLMPPLYELVIKAEPVPGPYTEIAPAVYGMTYRYVPGGGTWANVHDGAGTNVTSPAGTMYSLGNTDPFAAAWATLYRSLVGFDLSGQSGPIIAAYIALTAKTAWDEMSKNPAFNIFDATPANPGVLAAGDYGNCGVVPYSTAIPYASWPAINTVQNFVLNAAALAAINVAIGVGQFSVSLREAVYDAPNADPGALGFGKRMGMNNDGASVRLYIAREA